jgi:hypothetical protein
VQSQLVPELVVLDIIVANINLHLFAAMVHSRWRIIGNSHCPVRRLKTVRCCLGMYNDLPVSKSLTDLLKCRDEGMEIWIKDAVCGKDMLPRTVGRD